MTGRRRTNYRAATERRAPGTPAPGATALRTDPVRVTVDLTPRLHKRLKRWTNQAAVDLDLPHVALAEVIRILADEMLTDPTLSDTVQRRLAADQGK